MRVVTSAQMKQIEQNATVHGLTFQRLMENAGSAAAAFVRRTFAVKGLNCMVFCSKGNNGGDGLVVARKLSESGANVVVVLVDGKPATPESAAMYQTVQMMELPILDFARSESRIVRFLEQTDIVIDALCGTGFQGVLRDSHRPVCHAINDSIAAVVSLDLPSGVECDTGIADPDAVRADFTVTFDSAKPAHVLPASLAFCGEIEVVDIGIPAEAHEGIGPEFDPSSVQPQPIPEDISLNFHVVESESEEAEEDDPPANEPQPDDPEAELDLTFEEVQVDALDPEPELPIQEEAETVEESEDPSSQSSIPGDTIATDWVFSVLPPRNPVSHKGDHGKLLCIAGSLQYPGAASLCAEAALRAGAGLVTLASTENVCSISASRLPEAVYLPLFATAAGGIDGEAAIPLLEKTLADADAVVIGCGMGDSSHTAQLLAWVVEHATCPVIIDADGINAIAQNIHVLDEPSAPIILLPHLGEMARLLGSPVPDIQANRAEYASHFARKYELTLVLKGAGTLVASADGELLRNETGNAGLAKAGSGDLLAGITGAFLAQHIPPVEAAACAVHLHGLAGDRCAARLSQYAMLPSELLEDLAGIFVEYER